MRSLTALDGILSPVILRLDRKIESSSHTKIDLNIVRPTAGCLRVDFSDSVRLGVRFLTSKATKAADDPPVKPEDDRGSIVTRAAPRRRIVQYKIKAVCP